MSNTPKPLAVSVLSSCSRRTLVDLMTELWLISSVECIDLMLLRDIDIFQIDEWLRASGRPLLKPELDRGEPENRSSAQIMAEYDNLEPIADWIKCQLDQVRSLPGAERFSIAAFATYFPDVSDRSGAVSVSGLTIQQLAEAALTNSVRLGFLLQERRLLRQDETFKESVIVECVGGNILDRCLCEQCTRLRTDSRKRRNFAIVSQAGEKMRILADAFIKIAEDINSTNSGDWCLAAEMEPGPAYVLNGVDRMMGLIDLIPRELHQHVALNLDIAHAKICESESWSSSEESAELWETLRPHFAHAHWCDHPGMHTRDQAVGRWNPVHQSSSDSYELLGLFQVANLEPRESNHPPKSGAVALELEGCNRIRWVHNSAAAMKHAVRWTAQQ